MFYVCCVGCEVWVVYEFWLFECCAQLFLEVRVVGVDGDVFVVCV